MRPVQIALLVCGVTCNAAIQYQFSYTAVNGPVKDFSFLVTAPGYLAAGTAPNLAAFTPTDGTNSWTFTQWLVGMANPYLGCFLFGTASTGLGAASTGLIGGPCAVGISGTGFQPGLQFTARADYLQLLAPIQNSSSAADSGRPMRRETSAISVMPRAG
jgi:hypothetical protein